MSAAYQLLPVAAGSGAAVQAVCGNLARYLDANPALPLSSVASALQARASSATHGCFVVCSSHRDAIAALSSPSLTARAVSPARRVSFLFPGLGDQYPNMTAGLYADQPVFRRCVDHGAELLRDPMQLDVREVLYPGVSPSGVQPGTGSVDLAALIGRDLPFPELGKLKETSIAQPVLFIVEYALAKLWKSWGIQPAAMAGYSLGEYVAACLSGVISLDQALKLTALRAKIIQALPPGAMLALALSEDQARKYLFPGVSLSAINGPLMCVLAGTPEAISRVETVAASDRVACRRLQTTHAFHSFMMHPAAAPLRSLSAAFTMQYPRVPYLSNVTGDWITPELATDPDYWPRHMSQPVRFADALQRLWARPNNILLEVGIGQTLCSLAMQHPARRAVSRPVALGSLPAVHANASDSFYMLETLGRLWLEGVKVNWEAVQPADRRASATEIIEEVYGEVCERG